MRISNETVKMAEDFWKRVLKEVYAPYRKKYAEGLKISHDDLKRSSPQDTPEA